MVSQQKPSLLHKVYRVFGAFLLIAALPQKLDILVDVGPAQGNGQDVIQVVVVAKWLLAAGAFAALEFEELAGQAGR